MTTPARSKKPTAMTSADLDFDLWIRLDQARSALSRSRELELTQHGITLEQAAVLFTLQSKGGSATNAEIADSIIRQYNSVTTLVNRMINLGLVSKEKASQQRKFRVSISAKGRAIYAKVTDNSIHMAFADLPKADKQRLLSYLDQIVEKSRGMLGMDK